MAAGVQPLGLRARHDRQGVDPGVSFRRQLRQETRVHTAVPLEHMLGLKGLADDDLEGGLRPLGHVVRVALVDHKQC